MRKPRFDVYKDKSGQYRWRLIAANGRIIADSGEAYTRKNGVERAIRATIEATGVIERERIVSVMRTNAATRTREQLSTYMRMPVLGQ